MRSTAYILITAVALMTAACGSSPTSPSTTTSTATTTTTSTSSAAPTPRAGTGTFTALVDDVAFTPLAIQVSTSSGAVLVSATGVAGSTPVAIGFGVLATGTGTYVIPGAGASGGNNALLVNFSTAGVVTASWAANSSQGTGTVTVSALSTTSVSGTYTLTLQPSSSAGPAGTGTKVLTGTFNLTF